MEPKFGGWGRLRNSAASILLTSERGRVHLLILSLNAYTCLLAPVKANMGSLEPNAGIPKGGKGQLLGLPLAASGGLPEQGGGIGRWAQGWASNPDTETRGYRCLQLAS